MKKPNKELNRSITILKPIISQFDLNNVKTRNSGSFLTGKSYLFISKFIIYWKKSINYKTFTGIETSRTFKTDQTNCLTEKSLRKEIQASYTERSNYYRTVNFDNYSSRKFIIDEKRVGKILTYVEPFDYAELNKKNSPLKNFVKIPGIELNKSSPRNHIGLINRNNYPTPFTYSPYFNSIKPKVKNCKFFLKFLFAACVYNTKTKENIKKKIIRKVCFSYDQSKDIRVSKLKNLIDLAK